MGPAVVEVVRCGWSCLVVRRRSVQDNHLVQLRVVCVSSQPYALQYIFSSIACNSSRSMTHPIRTILFLPNFWGAALILLSLVGTP